MTAEVPMPDPTDWPEPTPPVFDLPEGEDPDNDCGQVPEEFFDEFCKSEDQ